MLERHARGTPRLWQDHQGEQLPGPSGRGGDHRLRDLRGHDSVRGHQGRGRQEGIWCHEVLGRPWNRRHHGGFGGRRITLAQGPRRRFETKHSKKNVILNTASGGEMGRYGEKEVTVRGKTGDIVGLKFEVMEVRKPILAVRRLVERGKLHHERPERQEDHDGE
jgi:hypothetical protein